MNQDSVSESCVQNRVEVHCNTSSKERKSCTRPEGMGWFVKAHCAAAVDVITPGSNMGGRELEVCLLLQGEQWKNTMGESWMGGTDSRLSSAALSRTAWGKVLNYLLIGKRKGQQRGLHSMPPDVPSSHSDVQGFSGIRKYCFECLSDSKAPCTGLNSVPQS